MRNGEATTRRCLVLGGSGYVGAAAVRALARDGARVAFTWHRGREAAEALSKELPGALALEADLAAWDGAKAAVARGVEALGGLNALVQCAGTPGNPAIYQKKRGGDHAKFLSISEADFAEMWGVTVAGTFAACQEATPHLADAGGGNIVVVGSMDGVKPLPAPIHYATAKGALRSLVESLAKELGDSAVRVNLVAPGILAGGLSRHLPTDLKAAYLEHCSLARLGEAGEVADLVAWLALENTYVTGQSILLDGGL